MAETKTPAWLTRKAAALAAFGAAVLGAGWLGAFGVAGSPPGANDVVAALQSQPVVILIVLGFITISVWVPGADEPQPAESIRDEAHQALCALADAKRIEEERSNLVDSIRQRLLEGVDGSGKLSADVVNDIVGDAWQKDTSHLVAKIASGQIENEKLRREIDELLLERSHYAEAVADLNEARESESARAHSGEARLSASTGVKVVGTTVKAPAALGLQSIKLKIRVEEEADAPMLIFENDVAAVAAGDYKDEVLFLVPRELPVGRRLVGSVLIDGRNSVGLRGVRVQNASEHKDFVIASGADLWGRLGLTGEKTPIVGEGLGTKDVAEGFGARSVDKKLREL